MRRFRVIPTLLLDSQGRLVKTVRFGKRTYIGDPINAVKIFNEKCVDELLLLDIDASRENREPNFKLIENIASEAFMPVGYGGGITSTRQAVQLLHSGVEKVVISTGFLRHPELMLQVSEQVGAQSTVACLNIKPTIWNKYRTVNGSGAPRITSSSPIDICRRAIECGAGEIIVYAIHRDGTFSGYDLKLLRSIAAEVSVPIVACGGAASLTDFIDAIQAGCSAVAAGSMFVYHGSNRAVLINYPSEPALQSLYERLAE